MCSFQNFIESQLLKNYFLIPLFLNKIGQKGVLGQIKTLWFSFFWHQFKVSRAIHYKVIEFSLNLTSVWSLALCWSTTKGSNWKISMELGALAHLPSFWRSHFFNFNKNPFHPATSIAWRCIKLQWRHGLAVTVRMQNKVQINLFCYSAPLKIFWRVHAPYLLKHLNSCTLFTDTSPKSPT